MDITRFERPVTVLVGFGFPRDIESVAQAYQFLLDWPVSARKAAHTIAIKACKAALGGEIDAEMARAAFVAFAQRNALLVPDNKGAYWKPGVDITVPPLRDLAD